VKQPADHIFQHTPETLRGWFDARGLPAYRAAQVLDWVYRKGIVDPAAMTNLSKREREVLASEMTFVSGEVLRHQVATDGTQKLLVEWGDGSDKATERRSDEGAAHGARGASQGPSASEGHSLPLHPSSSLRTQDSGPRTGSPDRQTECVMIPSEDATRTRRTACISSQVGCPVGCRFCASGLGGLDANLSAGRIIEQVWMLNWMLGVAEPLRGSAGERAQAPEIPPRRGGPIAEDPPRRGGLPDAPITNIVFMGMGEPLANFAAVVHAVRTIAAPWGMGISARKITISTVGMPRAIEKLAEQLELPVTLALSLHAPNDELRRELIPWAQYSTIPQLLRACRAWFDKTGREITLEYILLGGVNDRPEHAQQLAGIAKSLRANINLIRYNEVEPLEFRRPRDADVREFQHILRARGVNAHIRASRGRDIAAACGQLRHEATV
jgi:23S rRNA (adenine2503-C2)-methyltransferase